MPLPEKDLPAADLATVDFAPSLPPDCAAADPAWLPPPLSLRAAVAPAILCRSSKSESSEAA